ISGMALSFLVSTTLCIQSEGERLHSTGGVAPPSLLTWALFNIACHLAGSLGFPAARRAYVGATVRASVLSKRWPRWPRLRATRQRAELLVGERRLPQRASCRSSRPWATRVCRRQRDPRVGVLCIHVEFVIGPGRDARREVIRLRERASLHPS